jgi:hypothetical protein
MKLFNDLVAKFEVFTAVKIQVEVFFVVTLFILLW